MAQQECPSYYWIRAAEEMEHGDCAALPAVAAVHYELAYRYGLRATRISARPPKLLLIEGGKFQPRAHDRIQDHAEAARQAER